MTTNKPKITITGKLAEFITERAKIAGMKPLAFLHGSVYYAVDDEGEQNKPKQPA